MTHASNTATNQPMPTRSNRRTLTVHAGHIYLEEPSGGPKTAPKIVLSSDGIRIGCTFLTKDVFILLQREYNEFLASAHWKVLQP